jgi:hypothetical protein
LRARLQGVIRPYSTYRRKVEPKCLFAPDSEFMLGEWSQTSQLESRIFVQKRRGMRGLPLNKWFAGYSIGYRNFLRPDRLLEKRVTYFTDITIRPATKLADHLSEQLRRAHAKPQASEFHPV